MISVIIPAFNEPYLQRTIDDLLTKASGDIEIIVVLDGYWPSVLLPDYKNVTVIHRSVQMGMRHAINSAARLAKGQYLMKCDAHCAFEKGFDVLSQILNLLRRQFTPEAFFL